MSTELTESPRSSARESASGVFDAAALVSRKPSSVPPIYEYIVDHGPTSPKDIRTTVDVSKSVTFSSLQTLLNAGLITRPSRGTYEPEGIHLHPAIVHNLGELRSLKQLELCRFAARVETFETSDLTRQLDGHRSALRATARRLCEKGFLKQDREPFEKSPRTYRITEPARRGLAVLDVEEYRGRDGRHVSPYPHGIEGTDFRTAYEIEDAHYIAASNRRWVGPDEIAEALEKNHKKTLKRLSDMVDRGLLDTKPRRQKLVFEAAAKTTSMVRELRLFHISKAHQLNIYTIADQIDRNDTFTPDDLYAALVDSGHRPSPQALATAIEELKRAALIEGNSRTGYRFAQP